MHSLYLIPSFIGVAEPAFIPENTSQYIRKISGFIVEREKTARAFLKSIGHPAAQSDLRIHELDKHRDYKDFQHFFDLNISKADLGLISEAGLPAIADPGSEVVAYAHKKKVPVKPLAGSSSLFLALMASGLNGQKFTFHGYLPIQAGERLRILKHLERQEKNHSHLFIEAPYRNNELLMAMKENLRPTTRICIACELETPDAMILSESIGAIDPGALDLHKKPCIFIMMS